MSEEQTIKGIIESREEKSGLKADGSNWTKISFKIGGKTYSTFDVGNEFKSGDEVQVTYVQNDKYKNIKSITMIKSSDGEPAKITEEVIEDKKLSTKIEVIQNRDYEEFKRKVNKFNREVDCFATQTHVNVVRFPGEEVDSLVYTAVMFYR